MNLDLQKPHINYPCEWEYKIVGENEEAIRNLVFEIMPRQYHIQRGRLSSGGKFMSMYVRLEVQDENERNALFHALSTHNEVRMVL